MKARCAVGRGGKSLLHYLGSELRLAKETEKEEGKYYVLDEKKTNIMSKDTKNNNCTTASIFSTTAALLLPVRTGGWFW